MTVDAVRCCATPGALRILWGNPWGFESLRSHRVATRGSSPLGSNRGTPMRRALGIAAVAMLTAVPAAGAAQETPTERSAAADVIRRMNELERSLALPQLVARLTARDARRDAAVARARALMDQELLAMADAITRHPGRRHKQERSGKL